MKKNRTILFILFLSVIVLYPGSSIYGTEKLGIKSDIKQIEQGEEILVARNVDLASPVWCGENAFIVGILGEPFELQRIDFLRKKVVKIISGTYCYATDCTTDGKWVIYADKRNPRYDKGTLERVIIDFWRFNLITGQRQKFAIASDGTEGKWSPDGKKLLFGGPKPRSSIGQPEPKWKLVWTKTGGAFRQWLSDSSGIVIIARDKIYIEQAEKETVQLLNIDLGYIRILRVDRSNRIYLISRSKPGRKKEQLVRCEINGDTLRCEDALKRDKSILWYDITPDGEQIVFLEEGNTCAWHMRSRSSGPQCVVQQAGPTISISPDGKWLAFTRYRKIGESSGTDVVENDLYVTTLEDK